MMSLILILASVLGLVVLGVRLLRWVALVQQKEYRFDRLWLFLQTTEGQTEWFRFPPPSDFKKTSLKRPKITLRSGGVGVTSLVGLVTGMIFIWGWLGSTFSIFSIFLTLIIGNALIPLIVMAVGFSPGIFVWIYAQWLLTTAGKKLATHKPTIIGITGSYGKTATKLLLAHVLAQKFSVFMPPRSYNTVLSISQSILKNYSAEEIVIIEYGAYKKGEIKRLANKLHPTMAILTGLTEQHLGIFGSLTKIIEAKSELIAALPPNATVYCSNPEAFQIVASGSFKNLEVVKVWQHDELQGSVSKQGQLFLEKKKSQVPTKLVGLQYLDAVKTVWEVALGFGLSEAEILEALSEFVPPEGFTRLYSTATATVLDDGGTSNPAGFEAALTLAETLPYAEKILVTSGIVDLGDRSSLIHRQLAAQAKRVVNKVWYVGQAGKNEFAAIFGENLLENEQEIMRASGSLSKNTVLVIEGRMPAWFTRIV